MKDEELKKLVEEVIGNNDPFWNVPVYETVKKIVDLPDGTETSITKLLNNSQFTSKQLFDIYNCINRVCRRVDIVLDFSRENAKVDGLLYNLPFIIRKDKPSKLYEIQNLEEITEEFLMKQGAFLFKNYKIRYNPDRDTGVTELKIRDIVKNNDIAWEFGKETFGTKNCYKELKTMIINILTMKEILHCPNCGERLMRLMPDGLYLSCNNCNRCYNYDNGKVGTETESPYNNEDALY